MSANPARHRVARNDAPDGARGFWAAKDLLDGIGTGCSPKHARKGSPRYAGHIGRVGALAVSLGIGLAVANSATGVAVADSDSDSSSTSSSSAPGSGGAKQSAANSSSSGDRGQDGGSEHSAESDDDDSDDDDSDDSDDSDDDDADDADADSDDDDETAEPDQEDLDADEGEIEGEGGAGSEADHSDPETTDLDSAPTVESDWSPEAGGSQTTNDAGESHELDGYEQVAVRDSFVVEDGPTDPASEAVVSTDVAVTNEAASAVADVSSVTTPAEEEVSEVALFSAMVSGALAPLLAPELPVPPSIADALLAWFRRVVTHTFFNKTPVVRSVTTEQLITGQVIIDIDAYDPNGDPLTYEILQPANGFVFRDLVTGKFVYTPLVPVVGDSAPVEFQVLVRDDSENLTGALGSIQKVLHAIARVLGLAEAENYTQTVSFNADPIVQLPPSLLAVGGPPYILGGNPVKLLSVAEIIDLDSSSLQSATVTIGLGRQAGDTLGYVAPEGSLIEATWTNDYTLTLSGLASLAQYEAALKAITFSANELGLLGRTVDITLQDEHGVNSLLPAVVVASVLPAVHLPPSLVAAGGLPYVLGGDPVKLLSVAEIIDLDSSSLQSVTVTIGLGRQAGDTLGYVAPEGSLIEATWINDWTMTLSGLASLAQYEAALKAITFSADELGLLGRTVEITLTDDKSVESLLPTFVVVGVLPGISIELPLVVTPLGAPIHTIGKPPVKLVSAVSIANADDGMLVGATVAIGLGGLVGDKLTYTAPQGNPIVVVQTDDRTLTLSGLATVSEYVEALKAISFSATQLGLPRTVTITVVEADGDSNPVPGVVFANTVAPLLPTVTVLSLPPVYTLGKPGVTLASVVGIIDLDSATMTGATVKITTGRQAGDLLSYTAPAGNPITASWNGVDTLTFSGIGTLAQYEAALEAVKFSATAGVLIPRTVTINVTDDSGVSALLPAVVLANVKNPDRPTLAVLGLSGLAFPSVGDTVKPITSATIIDTDSTVLTGATVKITNRFTSGDTLNYTPIAGNPVTASYNSSTGQLTLSGTATLAQYKQALEAVTFRATQFGGGWLELSVTRTLTIHVTDDSNVSNLLPGIVLVTVYR